MANPLYHQMNGNNLMSGLQALRNNPVQFLMQKKLNIPQDIANDPNAIIKHLMDTGQVSQEQYNRAMQMAQKIKR